LYFSDPSSSACPSIRCKTWTFLYLHNNFSKFNKKKEFKHFVKRYINRRLILPIFV
jgi:hypothetical protein